MRVALGEPDLGAGQRQVAGHGGDHRAELARRGQCDEGLEGLGWEVVVDVAVGQRQRADPLRVAGREDLGHRSAGVVGDHVDAVEPERLAELVQEGGEAVEGQVGRHVRRHRRRAVRGQVGSDAATDVGDVPDHVAPQVRVDEDAVDQ